MPKIKVLNMKGEEIKEIDLPEELFAATISEASVHQAVVNQLANKRQGTQSAKLVQRLEAAEESHGDKRVLVVLDKVLSDHLNGRVAVLFLHQSQEIAPTSFLDQLDKLL